MNTSLARGALEIGKLFFCLLLLFAAARGWIFLWDAIFAAYRDKGILLSHAFAETQFPFLLTISLSLLLCLWPLRRSLNIMKAGVVFAGAVMPMVNVVMMMAGT